MLPSNIMSRVVAENHLVTRGGILALFLKPGERLHFIPGGRGARRKNAPSTVYRRALFILKDCLSGVKKLNDGT